MIQDLRRRGSEPRGHLEEDWSRKRAQLESPQECAWNVWETAGEVQVGSRLHQPGRVTAGAWVATVQEVGVNAQGAVATLAAGCSRRANKREHPGQLGKHYSSAGKGAWRRGKERIKAAGSKVADG